MPWSRGETAAVRSRSRATRVGSKVDADNMEVEPAGAGETREGRPPTLAGVAE